jgi:hyperosmotically inducible periplasmic protein
LNYNVREREMNSNIGKTTSFRSTLLALALAAPLTMGLGYGVAAAADAEPVAHSNDVGAAVSDTVITAKVKSKLAGDKYLKSSTIDVTTTNGVVTLTGSAAGPKSKTAAENMTKMVKGVKSVDNQLVTPDSSPTAMKTKTVMSDSWITTKVKSELLADSVTKGLDVKVETVKGVVMLSGALPSQEAIGHAKTVAGKVESVKSVDTSGLTVAAK